MDVEKKVWVAHMIKYKELFRNLETNVDVEATTSRIVECMQIEIQECRDEARLAYYENMLMMLFVIINPMSPDFKHLLDLKVMIECAAKITKIVS